MLVDHTSKTITISQDELIIRMIDDNYPQNVDFLRAKNNLTSGAISNFAALLRRIAEGTTEMNKTKPDPDKASKDSFSKIKLILLALLHGKNSRHCNTY